MEIFDEGLAHEIRENKTLAKFLTAYTVIGLFSPNLVHNQFHAMLSLWANWLVTKFGLNSLKRYSMTCTVVIFENGFEANQRGIKDHGLQLFEP